MAYNFTLPQKVILGKNSLEESMTSVKTQGKKALVVCGKVMTKNGTIDRLTKLLKENKIDFQVFNEIVGEPTDKIIEEGVKVYKKSKCDFCIGIGGGSPLDSAKAIAAMTILEGEICDYMGKELDGEFPPIVLIPTTAGTGSETTKFTIITDTKKDVKMLLKGENLLPKIAIIDYNLTISSPKSITAATGIDALTHAIESYTSRKANELTDLYALSAIKRIFKYLPIAYNHGENKKAREQMSLAAFEAGVCINNASVTLVHGMSRPIGALFHVPHGISNAMIIKECLTYVLDGCYDKFATIARVIGVAEEFEDDKVAANNFIDELERLCNICEIPTIEEYGINRGMFNSLIEKMACDAIKSGSPANTIKEISKADIKSIYLKL